MRSLILAFLGLMTAAALAADQPQPASSALDYATFKRRVQPILLAKQEGFARCYVCHSQATNFRLQRLGEGATAWTEEQSRKNFEAVSRLVVPGKPLESRLLLMPLSHDAGGTAFHPGGKRWESQNDREWRMLAEWVEGR